ncbi:MAG TPA: FAD-dependent oxidoreductase, partial [Anaerolineae bacterium]|nr:FAD-dependent oxidoreductase [Anaerolineae bacterium]
MSKGALVVGSGPAGLQAALDLAEAGIRVHLVERSPFLCPEPFGDAQDRPVEGLRGDGAGMPRHLLRPRLLETSRHPHIQVLTNAEVARLTGERGDFRVEVQQHPRYVDPSACTACSECVAVCPVTIQRPSDPLNAEKAIYKPEDGVPSVFAIEKRGPAPCKAACPAGIHVQGYVALIAQGRFQEALALIREVIPFPSVCGRICHHPCESACRRGEHDEPIAIRDLKRFVADWETGQQGNEERGDESPHSSLLPKVAIVGSGPAGLTAAYFLAREGHPVTVFEALPVAGGMMAVGIPEHRLPKDVLRREIEAIEELGVEIRLNTPVGRDGGPGLDELRREYDALFIAVGAHKSRRLGVSGEDLEGVLHGVDFLHRVNLGEDVALGRRVIVVGGGDVAVDSAMVARRLGAQQVTILYRRSRAEMPAHPWEVEEAEEEGIAFHFLASPVRVLGEKGRVVGLECVRMELGEPDESGRRRPIPIPGSEFTVEADTVIVAIGQAVDASFLEAGGWELGRGGRIAVDPLTLATGVPGVFAGGDAVTGPATVIEAIAA